MMSSKGKIDFWFNIMIDHCSFFLLTLSFKEIEFINQVRKFQKAFINIKQRSNDLSTPYIDEVSNMLNKFINLKKQILKELIHSNIELNMSPTFVNRMINEAEEFDKELQQIKFNVKENPIVKDLSLHKLWLPDASGHAAMIASRLDINEVEEIRRAKYFENTFNSLYNKVIELNKIVVRTDLSNNNLKYFNKQVIYKITEFIEYLHEINSLISQNSLLNFLNPLMLDHMIREEEYYLENILDLK